MQAPDPLGPAVREQERQFVKKLNDLSLAFYSNPRPVYNVVVGLEKFANSSNPNLSHYLGLFHNHFSKDEKRWTFFFHKFLVDHLAPFDIALKQWSAEAASATSPAPDSSPPPHEDGLQPETEAVLLPPPPAFSDTQMISSTLRIFCKEFKPASVNTEASWERMAEIAGMVQGVIQLVGRLTAADRKPVVVLVAEGGGGSGASRLNDAHIDRFKELRRQCAHFYSLDQVVNGWAMAHHNAGSLQQALDIFARLDSGRIVAPEMRFYIPYNRGCTNLGLKKYEDALADFTRALAVDPESVFTLNNRGYTLSQLGRHEDALADLDRCIALRPNWPNAYRHRGNCLRALGRMEEAMESFDAAVMNNPHYDVAWKDRGMTHLAADGDPEEALEDLHTWAYLAGKSAVEVRGIPEVAQLLQAGDLHSNGSCAALQPCGAAGSTETKGVFTAGEKAELVVVNGGGGRGADQDRDPDNCGLVTHAPLAEALDPSASAVADCADSTPGQEPWVARADGLQVFDGPPLRAETGHLTDDSTALDLAFVELQLGHGKGADSVDDVDRVYDIIESNKREQNAEVLANAESSKPPPRLYKQLSKQQSALNIIRRSVKNRPTLFMGSLQSKLSCSAIRYYVDVTKEFLDSLMNQDGESVLGSEVGITVRETPNRGMATFTLRRFLKGEVITIERPLTFFHRPDMASMPCFHCMTPIWHERVSTNDLQRLMERNVVLFCRHCSNHRMSIYCSAKCRDEAWKQYHRFFCVDTPENISATAREARRELAVASHKILDLLGMFRMVGLMLHRLVEEKRPPHIATRVVTHFYAEPDSLPLTPWLRRVHGLMLTAFRELVPGIDGILTTRLVRHILSARLRNAFSTTIRHPQWPRLVTLGLAMNGVITLLNHDCQPNATWGNLESSGLYYVYANRDIEPGEELTESYIQLELPTNRHVSNRRAQLYKNWNFVCRCSLCKRQAGEV